MFTRLIFMLLNIKGGELLSTLLEKIMSFDFAALKVTFHLLAHSEILIRSLFKISAVSAGSLPDASNEVSSAKTKISLSRLSVISLIYIINKRGPSLDP